MIENDRFAATASSQKRARFLLVVTSVVLAFWIAAMLVMYFTTVYPERHPTTKVAHAVRNLAS